MNLSAFAGNHAVKAQLSQQEEGRGLSHAYILSGPAGSGKHTLARLLCGAMLCAAPAEGRPCGRCGPCKKVFAGIHPDVSVISGPGEGKPIAVDQVRQCALARPGDARLVTACACVVELLGGDSLPLRVACAALAVLQASQPAASPQASENKKQEELRELVEESHRVLKEGKA